MGEPEKKLIDLNFDKKYSLPIIGVDEVGRGSWAGPVVAGASLIDHNKPFHKDLNDSKKLSEKKRNEVLTYMSSVSKFSLGVALNGEIDKYGITKATCLAMERAIINISKLVADFNKSVILIDGTPLYEFQNPTNSKIVFLKGGDGISPSIAAASIYAKNKRDSIMKKLDKSHPLYGWKKNMGYGTKYHREMIYKNGLSKFHRMTFNPMRNI